eukprot:m.1498968 g.1498968  ORF g.1498968 m.1498968 type:complete len:340 (-) comp25204_c0_seq26:5211-6230(-)
MCSQFRHSIFAYVLALWVSLQLPLMEHTVAQELRSVNELSLITTYWVSSATINHRSEIEAAMVLNIANNNFHSVFVLLDGTTSSYNCSHFERHIYDLIQRSGIHQYARLKCEPTVSWQTTYFDIFAYSFKLPFGHIAVVANADMIFDNTVRLATRLQPGQLFTVETQGGPTERQSTLDVTQVYASITHRALKFDPLGTLPNNKRVRSRCYTDQKRYSWDAYIFYPSDILEIRPDDFMYTTYQNRERSENLELFSARPLLMNQLGAENQALSVLQARSPHLRIYSICEYIHMYHLHQTGKTHGKNNWPILPMARNRTLAIGTVVSLGSETGKLLFGDGLL